MEKNNNNHYVYFHINLVSNEVFYVGKGNRKRAWSKTNRNPHWNNIVNKYGYRVYIVKDGLTDEQAKIREVYYIKEIGRKDLGLGSLVNFTDGGEGSTGAIRSNETLKKMRDARKGRLYSEESKQKMSESQKGKKRSEETKKKMSEFQKGNKNNLGKKHSEETKKRISELAKLRHQSKKLL